MDQLLVNFTGTRRGNDGVLPQTDANGFTKKGLACPKYYFMAILSEKGGEYHAVGFGWNTVMTMVMNIITLLLRML